jgi:energy-coupling factor transport system ATP-binding protein
MRALVEARIESYSFRGAMRPALVEVDLEVHEGEVLVVSGPVGSGKTALCHCLTGAATRFFGGRLSGSVRIGGVDPAGAPLYSRAGLVGYLT